MFLLQHSYFKMFKSRIKTLFSFKKETPNKTQNIKEEDI